MLIMHDKDPLTRVEKINSCIRYLFVNKAKSIKEIREILLDYNVDLSLVEILSIVQDLNYMPVKERKQTEAQKAIDKLRPLVLRLHETQLRHGLTSREVVAWLNYHEIMYHNGTPWTFNRYIGMLEYFNLKKKFKKKKYSTDEARNIFNVECSYFIPKNKNREECDA